MKGKTCSGKDIPRILYLGESFVSMICISYNFLRILQSNALVLDISFLLLNKDSGFYDCYYEM